MGKIKSAYHEDIELCGHIIDEAYHKILTTWKETLLDAKIKEPRVDTYRLLIDKVVEKCENYDKNHEILESRLNFSWESLVKAYLQEMQYDRIY
jgi:hypothetical protein